MTERDMLIKAAKRLNVLDDMYTTKYEMCINAYNDLWIDFDDEGNIIRFCTHP